MALASAAVDYARRTEIVTAVAHAAKRAEMEMCLAHEVGVGQFCIGHMFESESEYRVWSARGGWLCDEEHRLLTDFMGFLWHEHCASSGVPDAYMVRNADRVLISRENIVFATPCEARARMAAALASENGHFRRVEAELDALVKTDNARKQ